MKSAYYPLRVFRGIIYYATLNLLKLKAHLKIEGLHIVPINIGKQTFNMLVDMDDRGLSSEIFYYKFREYPNVNYFSKYLKKNHKDIDTVIDLGANIGYYVLIEDTILKNITNNKYRIIAIEPVSENINLLKKNIGLNLVENIVVAQNAVGDRDKKIEIIVPEIRNHARITGMGKEKTKLDKKQTVQMQTLLSLLKTHKIPNKNVLIRMDIEGYEYNLLMSNEKVIKNIRNFFLVFEFHPFYLGVDKTIEFLKYLKKIGFKLDQVVSCEPHYFLQTPKFLRKILKNTWLREFGGRKLGLLSYYKNIDKLIEDCRDERSAVYNYPNLHLYLHKK